MELLGIPTEINKALAIANDMPSHLQVGFLGCLPVGAGVKAINSGYIKAYFAEGIPPPKVSGEILAKFRSNRVMTRSDRNIELEFILEPVMLKIRSRYWGAFKIYLGGLEFEGDGWMVGLAVRDFTAPSLPPAVNYASW